MHFSCHCSATGDRGPWYLGWSVCSITFCFAVSCVTGWADLAATWTASLISSLWPLGSSGVAAKRLYSPDKRGLRILDRIDVRNNLRAPNCIQLPTCHFCKQHEIESIHARATWHAPGNSLTEMGYGLWVNRAPLRLSNQRQRRESACRKTESRTL